MKIIEILSGLRGLRILSLQLYKSRI